MVIISYMVEGKEERAQGLESDKLGLPYPPATERTLEEGQWSVRILPN